MLLWCASLLRARKVARDDEGIIEATYDNGADMVVTPCPVCQLNVEVYQDQNQCQIRHQVQDAGVVLLAVDVGGLW